MHDFVIGICQDRKVDKKIVKVKRVIPTYNWTATQFKGRRHDDEQIFKFVFRLLV